MLSCFLFVLSRFVCKCKCKCNEGVEHHLIREGGTELIYRRRERVDLWSYMEHSGIGGFLRNRRLGSYFDAGSGTGLNFSGSYDEVAAVKEEEEQQLRKKKKKKKKADDDVLLLDADEEEDGGGLLSVAISWIRIVVCFVTMMCTTLIWAFIMVLLLPWPYQRIKQGNIYGHFTGRLLVNSTAYSFYLITMVVF